MNNHQFNVVLKLFEIIICLLVQLVVLVSGLYTGKLDVSKVLNTVEELGTEGRKTIDENKKIVD